MNFHYLTSKKRQTNFGGNFTCLYLSESAPKEGIFVSFLGSFAILFSLKQSERRIIVIFDLPY